MSDKLIGIYRQAEKAFSEKNYEQALAGFATVIQAYPEHLWSRFQVGVTLEAMNKINRAFEVFEFLALHCSKSGFGLLGMDAAKRAERLRAGSDELMHTIVELYSLESDRIEPFLSTLPLPGLPEDLEIEKLIEISDKLPAVAEQIAKTPPNQRYPKQLAPIPMFSLLTIDAFFPILEIAELKTYQAGEVIIRQGDEAKAFYLLINGKIEVFQGNMENKQVLAQLGPASVFGEMALITEAGRTAWVSALEETDVLELRPEEMEDTADDFDEITLAMAKFTRQRFLQNLMNTSAIFKPFDPEDRQEILDRFTSVGIPTDEVIIQQGKPGTGLYLILSGEVQVQRSDSSSISELTNLKEGDVFGEISLLLDTPATATVSAIRGGEFLFLSREDFMDLVNEKPQISQALSEISGQRLESNQRGTLLI